MLLSRRPAYRQEPTHLPALREEPVVHPPSRERAQSVIDASLAITGDLHTEGDIQLDGHVCGNVQCAQLIVGRDAAITGAITAREIVVRGRVTGTIRASVIILQDTAHVESDIVYSLLAIDEGAAFAGAARHSSDPLQDSSTVSSLAELQQMLTEAEATTAAGSGGNGRPATQKADDPPAAIGNGRLESSHRDAAPAPEIEHR